MILFGGWVLVVGGFVDLDLCDCGLVVMGFLIFWFGYCVVLCWLDMILWFGVCGLWFED